MAFLKKYWLWIVIGVGLVGAGWYFLSAGKKSFRDQEYERIYSHYMANLRPEEIAASGLTNEQWAMDQAIWQYTNNYNEGRYSSNPEAEPPE